MKRREIVRIIEEMIEGENGVSVDEASEFASDLADRLEDEVGPYDEDPYDSEEDELEF